MTRAHDTSADMEGLDRDGLPEHGANTVNEGLDGGATEIVANSPQHLKAPTEVPVDEKRAVADGVVTERNRPATVFKNNVLKLAIRELVVVEPDPTVAEGFSVVIHGNKILGVPDARSTDADGESIA